MVHAVAFAILGRHPVAIADVPAAGDDDDWFDAADVVVRTSDGAEVVLGLRTSDYVDVALAAGDPPWPDGHRPLPITLDPAAVRHWDFGRVLWIGPADHPCVVWSNAEALSRRAVATMLGPDPLPARTGRLLDGPDGGGLPGPALLGVVVADDLTWIDLGDA